MGTEGLHACEHVCVVAYGFGVNVCAASIILGSQPSIIFPH